MHQTGFALLRSACQPVMPTLGGAKARAREFAGMKTFRSEEQGFEIDMSEDWSLYKDTAPILQTMLFRLTHGWTPHVDVAFTRGPSEIFNVVVESMTPEPPPEVTEHVFRLHAQQSGYANLEFGRIAVGGRMHTWARYQIAGKIWSKKYMIVLSGKGYAVTASSNDPKVFAQGEKDWDAIAASLRLLAGTN